MTVTTQDIKKDLNFCISQNGSTRKIFKILFQSNKPDFYILFPYFNAREYQMGTMTIPRGTNTLPTFDVSKNMKASSVLPVKFSYHLDGRVHFKPTNPVKALVAPAFKYDSIKATPMVDFSGEHIFSITFEGLEHFTALHLTEKSEDVVNVASKIPDNLKTFKVTGYAGFSLEEVLGKYGQLTPSILTLRRPQLSRPLLIGIYILVGEKSIQNGPDISPFLIALAGFRKKDGGLDNDLSTLYLYAK